MKIEEIVNRLIEDERYMRMGAGKLSNKFKCSMDDIYEAKRLAKQKGVKRSGGVTINKVDNLTIQEPVYISPSTETQMLESAKPLTPEQIADLIQADGINTYIKKVTPRFSSNGTWAYSAQVAFRDNFYTKEQLRKRLEEIFPIMTPISLPPVKKWSDKALVVLLSDDHAGALTGDSIFGNKWDASIYAQRLLHISSEIKRLNTTFEEVHVISLGDQMNGFNQQTTRGGHQVASLSNKEQFDIYTSARRLFYDDLFASSASKRYYVHDVENSNHTGNDFSYMANQLLHIYIENKYPQVVRKSYFNPIHHITYGIHAIGFGHGKDEKLMFKPMPLKLDQRTDLLLYQYFDTHGLSPNKQRITMYKGDLHSYAIDKGKFGRYINVPSIMGSTDYTEINFGNTEPGAVIEIFEKDTKNVQHIPIWF